MLSNVNALMIAWASSLILVVGGVLLLEATYTPKPHDMEATDNGAGEHAETNPDIPQLDSHSANTMQNEHSNPQIEIKSSPSTSSTAITGRPAPGQVTDKSLMDDAAGSAKPIPKIPPVALPDLLEQSPQGALPKIASDGRMPYQVYAAPAEIKDPNKPRISIMVTDLGMRSRVTRRALAELPQGVSLAFSPYSPNLNGWGEQARRAGFEVFLTIPMEPVNYPQNDPGPLTLLTELSGRDNNNILRSTLQKFSGYVGIVNHMGSRFTAASDSIKPVLEEIHKRGLMFVDSRTTPYSRAGAMARAIGLPVAINNGYIDDDLAKDQIAAELGKLEQRARAQGAAMGLARPRPVTLSAIKIWAASLEERGFVLVPVTSIANRQTIPR